MGETILDDEMLMAFADGELGAAEAAAVRSRIAADPALAGRVEVFRASRRAAKAAFAGILEEPAPERLAAVASGQDRGDSDRADGGRADGSNVIAFRRRAGFRAWAPSALAASLALGVGLGIGLWLDAARPGDGLDLIADAPGKLLPLLATQPSGPDPLPLTIDGRAMQLTIAATYGVNDGLCRSFALSDDARTVRGLACDHGAGYELSLVAIAEAGSGGFSAASDGLTAAADAYLDTLEASAPLGPDEERAALAGAN